MGGRYESLMRTGRLVPVCLVAALGACSAGSDGYDATRVENEMRAHVVATYPSAEVGDVSCPDDVEKGEGIEVDCAATVAGQELTLRVRQTDGDGNATYAQSEAVLDIAKVEESLGEELAGQLGAPVDMDCGGPDIRVVAPGRALQCIAASDGAGESEISVTVTDIEGHVRYDVKG